MAALRTRIEAAQQKLNILHDSHNYRKTIQIVNSFPKIEMFLMEDTELERMLRSFTQMHRQAGVKVVVAPSASETGLTLLLIMPNEYYLPEHIERMEIYLRRYLKATAVESRLIHLASDYLSLHVNLQMDRKEVQLDLQQLEQGLTRITMPWKLKFRELLEKHFADDSFETWERYSKAFNKDYRSRTHPVCRSRCAQYRAVAARPERCLRPLGAFLRRSGLLPAAVLQPAKEFPERADALSAESRPLRFAGDRLRS